MVEWAAVGLGVAVASSALHVTAVFKQEASRLAGAVNVLPWDVTGDPTKITAPLLGTWIYWETFTVSYCLPNSVLGEQEQLEKMSRFSA